MTKKYVEFMIVNGRDRYGKEHSPLFATALDRKMGNAWKSNPPKAPKGIRERDRTYRGANPSNQSGLYSLLYEMTNAMPRKPTKEWSGCSKIANCPKQT